MLSDLQPDLSPSDDERQDSLFDMPEDWKQDWEGMPEFENKNLEPFKTVTVHFRNASDYQQFCQLMDQNMTMLTKYLWFPCQIKTENKALRYYEEKS